MAEIRRQWDVLSREQRKHLLDEIVAQLQELQDSEPGIIAAGELLDIISQAIGPAIHNRALDEAKKAVETKIADLQVDLDLLRATAE